MKAISLWQPWASLFCSGRKQHETRHWATKYRGPLIVHAAKRFERRSLEPALVQILEDQFGTHWDFLPSGAIIGKVDIVDCKPTAGLDSNVDVDDYVCGDFRPGRFCWRAENFKTFRAPIPYRGAQGFFIVPDELLPEVAV